MYTTLKTILVVSWIDREESGALIPFNNTFQTYIKRQLSECP